MEKKTMNSMTALSMAIQALYECYERKSKKSDENVYELAAIKEAVDVLMDIKEIVQLVNSLNGCDIQFVLKSGESDEH